MSQSTKRQSDDGGQRRKWENAHRGKLAAPESEETGSPPSYTNDQQERMCDFFFLHQPTIFQNSIQLILLTLFQKCTYFKRYYKGTNQAPKNRKLCGTELEWMKALGHFYCDLRRKHEDTLKRRQKSAPMKTEGLYEGDSSVTSRHCHWAELWQSQ